MTSRPARFRAPARPSPTCISRSRWPWPATTPRRRRAPGRWTSFAGAGRYPSGPCVPAAARGFAAFERREFAAAIDALEPSRGELERIGGSRAQLDLVEFTLLKAYLGADRPDDARRMLGARRRGASGIPIAGLAAAPAERRTDGAGSPGFARSIPRRHVDLLQQSAAGFDAACSWRQARTPAERRSGGSATCGITVDLARVRPDGLSGGGGSGLQRVEARRRKAGQDRARRSDRRPLRVRRARH